MTPTNGGATDRLTSMLSGMESTTSRSVNWLLCLMFVAGCGDGKNSESTAASSESSNDDGTASTDSETTDGDWPECQPWSVSNSYFQVGPDAWSAGYDPSINWPSGHHSAVCVVDSTEVLAVPENDELMEVRVHLSECQDDAAQEPIALSLDLVLRSDVLIDPPPGLDAGLEVRVSYSIKIWQPYVYQSWYSLRDAATDELLLAAFSDPGPSVAPKIPGESDLENWLAPYTATLGAFGCAPDDENACSDAAPQRAFVTFGRDGSAWNVLGGTEGELGDYRVHLGFAGTPEACEGLSLNNVIEGIVVRKG
jgi:hypothetical protein